jgi:hypothetical protein
MVLELKHDQQLFLKKLFWFVLSIPKFVEVDQFSIQYQSLTAYSGLILTLVIPISTGCPW